MCHRYRDVSNCCETHNTVQEDGAEDKVPCSTLPGNWRPEDVAAARKALLSKARHLIPYLPPHTLNPDEADWLIKAADPSSNQL